jgi:hypothetical protein
MLSQVQENNSASVVVDDLIRWTSTESEKKTEVQKGKPTANSTPFEVNLSALPKNDIVSIFLIFTEMISNIKG